MKKRALSRAFLPTGAMLVIGLSIASTTTPTAQCFFVERYSIDPISPEGGPPGEVIDGIWPGQVFAAPAALGLAAMDNIDAISGGLSIKRNFSPPPPTDIIVQFSVTRGSVGAAQALVAESGADGDGIAADIF